MHYTLEEHGDEFEKMFWPVLRHNFPNYETFWREFVVPLTARPYGIGIRPKVDVCLEDMCMAHYSVYYHLGVARELIPIAC